MDDRGLVVDLFAGLGGWSCAAAAHDLDEVGIEIDVWACRTRAAAGHRTILADVSTFPLERLTGRVEGLIASPPCSDWSQSGKRAGLDGPTGALVLEVDRWVRALRPRWVACEQVPPALQWWNRFAHEFQALGYSTWAGVLNSADYGVPQTRERAILICSLDRKVGPPPATHAKNPQPSLFGPELEAWVSMAQALGWGTGRREAWRGDWIDPSTDAAPTVCGRGEPRWSYKRDTEAHQRMAKAKSLAERLGPGEHFTFGDVVQANGAIRKDDEPAPTITSSADNGNFQFRVGFPRLDDRGDSPDGYRERDWRDGDEPAFTLTEKARSWIVQTGNNSHVTSREGSKAGEGGVELYERSVHEPAPTLDTGAGGKWRVIGVNTGRDWKPGGTRDDAQTVPADEPAPTIDGKGRWHALVEDGVWDEDRPDAIRLTIIDALILQSFDPAYPVAGNKTKQFEQVGNAIPPLLAWHILGQVVGDAT